MGSAGLIGVNYGRLASDLPRPERVVELLKSHGLKRMKLYDADESVLRALSGSGIKVIVGVPNDQIASIAQDQNIANQWVEKNIVAYYPSTQIQAIAVGNQVFIDPNDITRYLVPAMINVHTALTEKDLQSAIKVSSPMAYYPAIQTSYPPSKGSFQTTLIEPVIKPMLDFLRETGSYLMMNIYPFFAYTEDPRKIFLDYAIFRENQGVIDFGNNKELRYSNLFDAQVDAVYFAMSALGYADLKLVVTESGWPSVGDELGAGIKNAAAYNGNLVKRVLTGVGTPLKTDVALDVYLFALFNENQKPGPTSERNFGLFYPNETKVYDIPFDDLNLSDGIKIYPRLIMGLICAAFGLLIWGLNRAEH